MSISVVIPTYNSAATIQSTLNSVLQQTLAPNEILIMDDGSTDNTVAILNSYGPRVTVFEQKNQGVASVRNALCEIAQGDLIAFLDHDDLWHPSYLEVQQCLFDTYQEAVAFFTGHVNFHGFGYYDWKDIAFHPYRGVELIEPKGFIRRYTYKTKQFASMSFCCIPKSILRAISKEPFCTKVSGADDFYLVNMLPLIGPVVYAPVPLVAYRITREAQSENRLKSTELAVVALEQLAEYYENQSEPKLNSLFKQAFAIKIRYYAKLLMSAGKVVEARKQLCYSICVCFKIKSVVKSIGLLMLTYMPTVFQPQWVSIHRQGD